MNEIYFLFTLKKPNQGGEDIQIYRNSILVIKPFPNKGG